MNDDLNYTHYAFFPDGPGAAACAAELDGLGFLTAVDPDSVNPDELFLQAARPVAEVALSAQHAFVEAMVTRHGGMYDGGEATYYDHQARGA